jgi:hypothetical protein
LPVGLLWPLVDWAASVPLVPPTPLLAPPLLAPPAPLLAPPPAPPPPAPPPPPPPWAIAPELSASAATNESAKIVARDMLGSMLLRHSRAPPKGGAFAACGNHRQNVAPSRWFLCRASDTDSTKKPRRSGAKLWSLRGACRLTTGAQQHEAQSRRQARHPAASLDRTSSREVGFCVGKQTGRHERANGWHPSPPPYDFDGWHQTASCIRGQQSVRAKPMR